MTCPFDPKFPNFLSKLSANELRRFASFLMFATGNLILTQLEDMGGGGGRGQLTYLHPLRDLAILTQQNHRLGQVQATWEAQFWHATLFVPK